MSELVEITEIKERSLEIDLDYKENLEKATEIWEELKEYLATHENEVCISAPQLGYNDRIFALKFADGTYKVFTNPMITTREGMHLVREHLANIPKQEWIVPRNDKIILIFTKENRLPDENMFDGEVAEVIQQMVDLLDGVFPSDIGLEVIEGFDEATDEEREEVIKYYIDEYLPRLTEEINKEIDEDPDLHKQKEAIDYMSGVATGKVKISFDLPKLSSKDVKNLKNCFKALNKGNK